MFNPNADTHENLPESKPKCYWCEKTLRHFKGYFCSQRCGTLAGNALLSEMGIVWNESEQRWDNIQNHVDSGFTAGGI